MIGWLMVGVGVAGIVLAITIALGGLFRRPRHELIQRWGDRDDFDADAAQLAKRDRRAEK